MYIPRNLVGILDRLIVSPLSDSLMISCFVIACEGPNKDKLVFPTLRDSLSAQVSHSI